MIIGSKVITIPDVYNKHNGTGTIKDFDMYDQTVFVEWDNCDKSFWIDVWKVEYLSDRRNDIINKILNE